MTDPTRIEPMSTFSPSTRAVATSATRMSIAQRSPQRISATLPWSLYQRLLDRAAHEGRSLSNLAAHLLEGAV